MKQIETITQTNQYNEFFIESVLINPNDAENYCKIEYYIKGIDCLDGGMLKLTAEDVAIWGESDDVLYDIACKKLGFNIVANS